MCNNQDTLMHYGIPKMQWGVRNGPPYPLSTYKKEQLRKKNKKLKEKQKIQELKNKQLEIKNKIKEDKATERLLKKQLRTDKGRMDEYNSRRNKSKGLKNLTDEEVRNVKQRMDNEASIRKNEFSSISNGKSFVKAALLVGGTVAATAFVSKVAASKGNAWADSFIEKGGPIKRASKGAKQVGDFIFKAIDTRMK